jgi:uncharacterized protein YceK
MRHFLVCLIIILVSGCATTPPKPPAYAELLSKAKMVQAAGDNEVTKQEFESITKLYPRLYLFWI